jgi:hypothetical protein
MISYFNHDKIFACNGKVELLYDGLTIEVTLTAGKEFIVDKRAKTYIQISMLCNQLDSLKMGIELSQSLAK